MTTESSSRHYPTLLVATVKSAIAIALLSVLATHWLQSGFDQRELSRLSVAAAKSDGGPTMTGSLARSISQTKLDPCTGKTR